MHEVKERRDYIPRTAGLYRPRAVIRTLSRTVQTFAVAVVIAACGGGGGGGQTFLVSGTASGIPADDSLVIRLAVGGASETLTVDQDGSFGFARELEDGDSFSVAVDSPPSHHQCSVNNASGVIDSRNVDNVQVTCELLTFPVGGTLQGFEAEDSLTLENEATGDSIVIEEDGDFEFPTEQEHATSYTVAIVDAPNVHQCTLENESGQIDGEPVSDVLVSCELSTFAVGGTVEGFEVEDSLTLENEATGDSIVIEENGDFAFPTEQEHGDSYTVAIVDEPSDHECTLENESGEIGDEPVSDVLVSCEVVSYTVGGTLSGLAADASVTLQNEATDELLTLEQNGAFQFDTEQLDEESYSIIIDQQPEAQRCEVENGSGQIEGENVDDVEVTCEDLYDVQVTWEASRHSQVNAEGGGYLVHYSDQQGFDPQTGEAETIEVLFGAGGAETTATEAVIEDLPAGTWYVRVEAVAVVDGEVHRSELSGETEFDVP